MPKASCIYSKTKKLRQLHSETPNLKQIVIIKANHKKINMKNNQLKTKQLLNQSFCGSKFQYYVVCQLRNLI